MSKRQPRILFYDIESTPLKAYIWKLGEQIVSHSQLTEDAREYKIICISYAWNDGRPAKTIHWGYNEQDSEKVIREFDRLVRRADITIGKNSDRFDVKHINTQRFLSNLPPLPEWMDCADDVEKQIRKYFMFPSYSLDYVSKELGLGGKVKMEMQDWIDVVEKRSRESFRKICRYNRKDVEDTRAIWDRIKLHVKPKSPKFGWDKPAPEARLSGCPRGCEGFTLQRRGTAINLKGKYARLQCTNCGHWTKEPEREPEYAGTVKARRGRR